MSSRDLRYNQLAISFNFIKKHGETWAQRSTKKLQDDTEYLTLEILISNSSTSTIIQEEENIKSKLLTEAPPQNHNTNGLVIKLNLLKEKSAKYISHRDFLSIQKDLVPKGLEITPESTIRNFHQGIADDWYTNLKQFSVVLMKQTAAYCDKTEQKAHKKTQMQPKQS